LGFSNFDITAAQSLTDGAASFFSILAGFSPFGVFFA
jgi:hypothetical protein